MQRSSDTIGAIAAALAKAQAELTNPEKSLTAVIPSALARGEDKSFRYAPLSTGLEIVRKTLSKHEIAAVQTTAIDPNAGLIRLTTTLAHSSGEWVSSEWPVCTMAETAAPHRMGAALTYARRYALFTLVGIAGEDDTDAPDLAPSAGSKPGCSGPIDAGLPRDQQDRGRPRHHAAGKPASPDVEPTEPPDYEELLAELSNLDSDDDLAAWAQSALVRKRGLPAEAARKIESAFSQKLSTLGERRNEHACVSSASEVMPSFDVHRSPTQTKPGRKSKARPKAQSAARSGIDKSVLAFPEPRRLRDKEHLKFVAGHPCLICGRTPSDAHHLRHAQVRGIGLKVSDEFTVPLCRTHHRELHRTGDEAAWWRNQGQDPLPTAQALWRETHPLSTAISQQTGATPCG